MNIKKTSSLRVLISGGGTGGHIYPALAIIDGLKKRAEENGQKIEFLYIGTKEGLEAKIVPNMQIEFQTVKLGGFTRKLTIKNLLVLWWATKALFDSIKIIRRFKPDLAIGTGGFVCGPIILIASLMGVPALIQEQNALPGFTNKILSLFVKKIALGYQSAQKYFPFFVRSKLIFTGNPVREGFFRSCKGSAREVLMFSPEDFVVVVAGGSRGARSINRAMLNVHRYFANMEKVKIIHITGKNDYEHTVEYYKEQAFFTERYSNVKIYPYMENMPEVLCAADLAVFRAGAVGLAEICVCGLPSILIPYPYAAENHQEFNAKALEEKGAAIVIKDNVIANGDTLLQKIIFLWQDKTTLDVMADASKKMGDVKSVDHILNLLYNLIKIR